MKNIVSPVDQSGKGGHKMKKPRKVKGGHGGMRGGPGGMRGY